MLFHVLIFRKIMSIIKFVLMKDEVWLSLVERCVRDAKATGSNPAASTIDKRETRMGLSFVI